MMEKHSSIHTFPEYALFEYCPCAPCSFSFPFYPGSQIYLRYDLWVCRLSFSSIFFFITKPYQPKLGSPPPHNNPCWPPARQGKARVRGRLKTCKVTVHLPSLALHCLLFFALSTLLCFALYASFALHLDSSPLCTALHHLVLLCFALIALFCIILLHCTCTCAVKWTLKVLLFATLLLCFWYVAITMFLIRCNYNVADWVSI